MTNKGGTLAWLLTSHPNAALAVCALALCLQGIGMNVIAYDVRKNPAVEALGIPYMALEEALPQADVISLHVPLLKATHHIINSDRQVCCLQSITH